jgi:Sec-independent protein translocase protein TatA
MPFNLSGWAPPRHRPPVGSRLPSVGRTGKGIVEFKKGLKGVEDEVDREANRADSDRRAVEDRPYRAPLTSGEDRRVSRADVVEEPIETKPAH